MLCVGSEVYLFIDSELTIFGTLSCRIVDERKLFQVTGKNTHFSFWENEVLVSPNGRRMLLV